MTTGSSQIEIWRWRAIWFALAVVAGIVVGGASAALQQAGSSLFLLQPLGLGGALGVALIGAVAILRRPIPWWGGVAAGFVAVATQHVGLYRAELAARQRAVDKQAMIEMFKPGWSEEGFFSYLVTFGSQPNGAEWVGKEWPNFVLWGIDACLLVVASVTIVEWYRRRYQVEVASRSDGQVRPAKADVR